MQYMLLLYDDETVWQTWTEAKQGQVFGAYMAYTEAMKSAGAYVAGDPLQPTATATKVSVSNGAREVVDGPYAETKEQLGGYYLVDAKDLDEALDWAAKCPCAVYGGTVEVRPIMVIGG